jgi:hypothetical protein
MTWRLTDQTQYGTFIINKLLATVSGMAVMALCALVALWKGGICIPDQRFYSVLFGVSIFGLYIAVVINLSRLRRRLKADPALGPGQHNVSPVVR